MLPARQDAVTKVLAHDFCRDCLLMADAGRPTPSPREPAGARLEILTAYKKLQIDETGHADEHRVVT
jgi:hypothetical protein